MTRDDIRVEAALLSLVLDRHPGRLTEEELIREMAGDKPGRGERIEIEQAARELTKAGLLHRSSAAFIVPTRAALHYAELVDDR